MKTVTGKIISSTPVSITKAASVLSKFVSKDTGASPAICAYLRRATAAFDELARLHSKSSRRKHKKHKLDAWETSSQQELTHGVQDEKGNRLFDEGKAVNKVKEEQSQAEAEQKKKKEDEEKVETGNAGRFVDNGAEGAEGDRLVDEGKMVNKVTEEQSQAATEQKKKKKKDKHKKLEIGNAGQFSKNSGEVVDGRDYGVKEEIEEEEKNGGKIGIDVEKMDEKNKKKRKNRDVEEEEKDGLHDHQSTKNKKRRKQSGEVHN